MMGYLWPIWSQGNLKRVAFSCRLWVCNIDLTAQSAVKAKLPALSDGAQDVDHITYYLVSGLSFKEQYSQNSDQY